MIKSLINDPDELKKLYIDEGKSLSQIGKICGVAFQTVHKWMKKNNIPLREWTTKGLKLPSHTLSEEVKKRLSILKTGTKQSAETKEKISQTIKTKGIKAGRNNSGWNGGKFINKQGYMMIWVGVNIPHKKEHRLVMEQHIGRELKRSEHIHHINGNKLDNRIENLQIVSNYEHSLIHWTDPEVIKKQSERLKKIRAEKFWSSNPDKNKQ